MVGAGLGWRMSRRGPKAGLWGWTVGWTKGLKGVLGYKGHAFGGSTAALENGVNFMVSAFNVHLPNLSPYTVNVLNVVPFTILHNIMIIFHA